MFPGIAGKVAIVTGSGRGLGEAYAKALAEAGAKVVVAEIDKQRGEQVASEIRAAGGQAAFAEVDVASQASTQALAAAAVSQFGGIDLLVNNAAIFKDMKLASLMDLDWTYYKPFM